MKKLLIILIMLAFIPDIADSQVVHWKRMLDNETFDIAVNPYNNNTIFAGGRGRALYRSFDGGVTWDTTVMDYRNATSIFNNVKINPVDTNIIIIGGLNYGQITRSTDNGDTWTHVLNKDYPIFLNGKALIMQPDDPSVYYIGNYQNGCIYKTTDTGATWDSIAWIPRYKKDSAASDFEHPQAKDSVIIGSMGIRYDSTNIVFTNSTSGRIYMSTDYGFNWKYVSTLIYPSHFQSDCEITRLVFSERDPLVGYAIITYLFKINTNNGGVYKTTDGGYNWEYVALRDTSMWAMAVRQYQDTEEIFIGGYTGQFWDGEEFRVPGVNIVMRSQDAGKTWFSYDGRVDWIIESEQYGPRGNVWSMRFFGNDDDPGGKKLYMATEAGLFVLENPSHIGGDKDDRFDNVLKVYQAGDNEITINFDRYYDTKANPLKITIFDIEGRIVHEGVINNPNDIIQETIYIKNPSSGAYVCRVVEENSYFISKIILK